MARLLFAFMRTFFAYLVEQDIIKTSPMSDLKAPKASDKRDRYLQKAEIKIFWNAASQLKPPYQQFYKLALLTGARNETELAQAKWEKFNLVERVWVIPANRCKNKQQHIVHLSQLAIDVLNSLPRTSDYMFAGYNGEPFNTFSYIKKKFDKHAKLENFRLHDARRSFGSWCNELGVPIEVIELCLNHKSGERSGIKGVYNCNLKLEARTQAFDLWGSFVDECAA